jgi:hypothetical protein
MEGNHRLFSWPHFRFTAGSLFYQIKGYKGQKKPSAKWEGQKPIIIHISIETVIIENHPSSSYPVPLPSMTGRIAFVL